MDLARAQLIRDLRDDIGVNNEGIGVILNLVDQLHGIRSVLQTLLANFGSAERSG
jgi:chaperone modulatory protein CbpM